MKRPHAADANIAGHIVFATDKANPEPMGEPRANYAAACWTVAGILLAGIAAARWLT